LLSPILCNTCDPEPARRKHVAASAKLSLGLW
jgi:hypothetical protein